MNQFQIESYFGDASVKTGLFDWIIVSPASTVQLLEQMLDGTIYEKFLDASLYVETHEGKTQHMGYESLYLWHEDMYDMPRLLSKMRHLIDNTLTSQGAVSLLWTNAQTDLDRNVHAMCDDMRRYMLTEELYARLEELSLALFGATCQFVTIPTRVDMFLVSKHNVTVFDAGDIGDFRGNDGLYDALFSSMLPALDSNVT